MAFVLSMLEAIANAVQVFMIVGDERKNCQVNQVQRWKRASRDREAAKVLFWTAALVQFGSYVEYAIDTRCSGK